MTLSQAVTRRFQASILLPSLPRSPHEVVRPFTPPEAPIERSQEPTHAEKDAERREREANARSNFRSGFITQEVVSLSAEALALNQNLPEDAGGVTAIVSAPMLTAIPQSERIETSPEIPLRAIETIELEPTISLPDTVVDQHVQAERQGSVDQTPVKQNTQSSARGIDLFG